MQTHRRFACLAALGIGVAVSSLSGCALDHQSDATDLAASDVALESEWGEIDEDATPIANAEIAEAIADGDDEVVGDFDSATIDMTELEDLSAPTLTAPLSLPTDCDKSTSLDLAVYTEGYNGPMLKALASHANPCSRYVVAVPVVSGSSAQPDASLWPRAVHGEGVRAYGSAFVASAEVHWGGHRDQASGRRYPGWKNVKVVKLGPARYETVVVGDSAVYDDDWFLKGVLYRQRMAKRGFRPQSGDTWHINELESAWTRTRVQQKAIRDLVRGLAAGDQEYDASTDTDPDIAKLSPTEKAEITAAARFADLKGIVFVSAITRKLPTETTDAPAQNALKQTLRHQKFWTDMNAAVKSFAVERYTSMGLCDASLDVQTKSMEAFIMELELTAQGVPRYQSGAHKGQSPVATALSYLSRAYDPVISAAWGFENNGQSLSTMRRFVAAQIYTTRRYANDHVTPDGRIGIYYKTRLSPPATDAETSAFADAVARALDDAYDGHDGRALDACGPAGSDGCVCR
jgi:hypothetical protein